MEDGQRKPTNPHDRKGKAGEHKRYYMGRRPKPRGRHARVKQVKKAPLNDLSNKKAPDNEGKINQLLGSLEELNSGASTIMHKISRDLDQEKKKLTQTLQDKEEETLSLEEVMKKTVQQNDQVLEEIQHLKAENVKLEQQLKTLLADLSQSDDSDPLTDNEAQVPVNPTEDSNSLAAAECTKDLIEMIQFVASSDDDSQDSVNAVASFMRKYPAMSSEALRRAGFAAW